MAVAFTGRAAVTEQALRGWRTQPPPVELAAEVVVACHGDEIVGYGDVSDQGAGGSVLWADARGPELAVVHEELEQRARARLQQAGVVRAAVAERDEAYRRLLAGRGYGHVRATVRLEIDLDGRTLCPAWPEGVTIGQAVEGVDEPLRYELDQRSFAGRWGFVPQPHSEWLPWLRELGTADTSLLFVAEASGEPVGVALCRPEEYGDAGCGWVSTLGVLPEWRRRGVGEAMVTHTLSAFQERGLPRAGLAVDVANESGALRRYARVGMGVADRTDIWEVCP